MSVRWSRPARRLGMLALGACLLLPGGSEAASGPTSVRVVYADTDFRSPFTFSSGGEYAIAVSAAFSDSRLISMSNGSVGPSTLTRPVPTANGAFIFGSASDQTIDRYDVETKVTTSRVVPFAGPSSDWAILSIADADDAGRFVLFRASNGVLGRAVAFLFDFENGTLVRANGDAISGDVTNAFPHSISPDGAEVVYSEMRDARTVVVRWDRTTDTRTEFQRPTEFGPGPWDVSPDFEWEVFSSSAAEVLPGLDASLRYYRRNLVTGTTEVVAVDAADVRDAHIYADGRVVMQVVAPTAQSEIPNQAARQLFVSDPGQPARQISVKPDGSPPGDRVGQLVAANVDATAISFTASNESGWRWYVAEVPAAITRIDGAAAATSTAVRCSVSALC